MLRPRSAAAGGAATRSGRRRIFLRLQAFRRSRPDTFDLAADRERHGLSGARAGDATRPHINPQDRRTAFRLAGAHGARCCGRGRHDPLAGVKVPTSSGANLAADQPSHLQQVHAELVARLPLPGATNTSPRDMPELRTNAELASYIESRTALWLASKRQ